MTYVYTCHGCGFHGERSVPCADRDMQFCRECLNPLVRSFIPSHIMIPERFGMSMARLAPTYDECAAIDKRNEEWLNRKKPPAKPDFETCLEEACVENRVDPKKLEEYTLRNAVGR